jgi:hypothetical protein
MFWIYGQGFFSGYYQSSATLNVIGDNAFVYTEDALVRDISVAPFNDSLLVATTNSGVFVSYNSGQTWEAKHGTTGSNALPEQPANNLQNIDEVAIQHKEEVNSITFLDEDEWWVGIKGTDDTKTVYRTTNASETWKKKNTGMPTFDGHNPTVNKLYFYPGSDDIFAASMGGLYFKSGSRFKNKGLAFPDPTTNDWPSIPAYDVIAYDTMVVVATEFGLFTGSIGEDFEDALPTGNGTSNIENSYLTYVTEEIIDSSKTDNFTWNWDTGDTLWVYEQFTFLDTISWHLAIEIDESDLVVGQFINVIDTVSQTRWKSILDENGVVELKNEVVYFEGELDVDDADTTTYTNYDISNLIVYPVGVNPVYDIALDSLGNVFYSTGNEILSTYSGSLGVFTSTINDIALSADESTLFAATSEGLQKLVFGQDEWTEITPKISTVNTGIEISYIITSITVLNDTTIFVGCGNNQFDDPRIVTYRTGGVLASFDGGETWQSKNIGLTHRSSNSEDVDSIISAIDSTTNVNAEIGLYEYLTSLYGNTADVDGSSKINVLIADMDDNAYNSTSDLVVQGYFNPADQDVDDENGNNLDMFYLDSDPQDPGEAQEGLAHGLSRLINYNYDANEEEWVLAGLDHFAAYITGHKNMPNDSLFTVENDNSLQFGDFGNEKEFNQLFVLMAYLHEHYFNGNPFDENVDVSTLISTLVQDTLQGINGLENALLSITNNEKDFSDVFQEWAIALHLDNPDIAWNSGVYGFTNIDVEVAPSTFPWGVTSGYAPYTGNVKNWSVEFMQAEKWVDKPSGWENKAPDFNDSTLVFNASDASDVELIVIQQGNKSIKDSTVFIDGASLDNNNKAVYTNWNDFGSDSSVVTDSTDLKQYQYFALLAVFMDAGDDAGGSYVVDDETISPSMFNLQIDQNSELLNYLDVYAFGDIVLYGDGASGIEGPLLEISDGENVLDSFTIPQHYDAGNGFTYRKSFDLKSFLPTTISEFLFIGSAESIGGNEAESDSVLIVAIESSDTLDRQFSSNLDSFSIKVPANTLENEELLIVSETVVEEIQNQALLTPLHSAFMVGNETQEFNHDILISFDISKLITSDININNLDIVYYFNGNFESLDAEIDFESLTISANLFISCKVQLVINPLKNELNVTPEEFKLYPNYPNPFNPSTTIKFEIPQASTISLKIFDIMGREVTTLINGYRTEGYHEVVWNGIDKNSHPVSSGIYFYKLHSNQKVLTQKMVLVK